MGGTTQQSAAEHRLRQPVSAVGPQRGAANWMRRQASTLVPGLALGAGHLVRGLALAWGTLAICCSNLSWEWARLALAAGFFIFGVYAMWIARRRRIAILFALAFLAVVIWFALIPPSHDRPWRREVAVMPRAIIDADGDRVRLTGFRNFTYRSRDDFDVRYEEREVSIADVRSFDLLISYWWPGPIAHTFVTFHFGNSPPVCISIETRPEEGEQFAPIRSMFKQFELIYIVGAEEDLVRVRTDHRDEEVYIYPIQTSPEAAQRLFRIYVERINELADEPEWYHLLKNNCTINIVRYANRAGRGGRWDLRHLLNGWADRYLYQAGAVDTTLRFRELRARSRVTEASRGAPHDETYSEVIRAALPGRGSAAERGE